MLETTQSHLLYHSLSPCIHLYSSKPTPGRRTCLSFKAFLLRLHPSSFMWNKQTRTHDLSLICHRSFLESVFLCAPRLLCNIITEIMIWTWSNYLIKLRALSFLVSCCFSSYRRKANYAVNSSERGQRHKKLSHPKSQRQSLACCLTKLETWRRLKNDLNTTRYSVGFRKLSCIHLWENKNNWKAKSCNKPLEYLAQSSSLVFHFK